jgi:hypothetical protein
MKTRDGVSHYGLKSFAIYMKEHLEGKRKNYGN